MPLDRSHTADGPNYGHSIADKGDDVPETKTTTIDLTPTWRGILPALLDMSEHGSVEAEKTAVAELTKMARLADRYVESTKTEPTVDTVYAALVTTINDRFGSISPNDEQALRRAISAGLGK